MVKRINVSLSDELYKEIESVKKGFTKGFSISKVCQRAIELSLADAGARNFVWDCGIKYGEKYITSLAAEEQRKVAMMAKTFPKKMPEVILNYLIKHKVIDQSNLQKHMELITDWKDMFYRFDTSIDPDSNRPELQGMIDIYDWCGGVSMIDGTKILDDDLTENRMNEVVDIWRRGVIAGMLKIAGQDPKN